MVMSTGQLAKCLSMNPKVISRMRLEDRFPIKAKLIGTKIVYPLGAIAEYLCSDEPEPTVDVVVSSNRIAPTKRRLSSRHSPVPDLSRKMLSRGFVSNLESQIEAMEGWVTFFSRKLESEHMHASLKGGDTQFENDPEVKI